VRDEGPCGARSGACEPPDSGPAYARRWADRQDGQGSARSDAGQESTAAGLVQLAALCEAGSRAAGRGSARSGAGRESRATAWDTSRRGARRPRGRKPSGWARERAERRRSGVPGDGVGHLAAWREAAARAEAERLGAGARGAAPVGSPGRRRGTPRGVARGGCEAGATRVGHLRADRGGVRGPRAEAVRPRRSRSTGPSAAREPPNPLKSHNGTLLGTGSPHPGRGGFIVFSGLALTYRDAATRHRGPRPRRQTQHLRRTKGGEVPALRSSHQPAEVSAARAPARCCRPRRSPGRGWSRWARRRRPTPPTRHRSRAPR